MYFDSLLNSKPLLIHAVHRSLLVTVTASRHVIADSDRGLGGAVPPPSSVPRRVRKDEPVGAYPAASRTSNYILVLMSVAGAPEIGTQPPAAAIYFIAIRHAMLCHYPVIYC